MNNSAIVPRWQDPEIIRRVVTQARSVAVVGASPDPDRPSHGVARYLHSVGLRVFPVNPAISSLFGLTVYPSLADLPEHVDIVDVFRRPEYVREIAEAAVTIGADALWLQLGVVDPAAAQLAEAGGLDVVMDRCLAIEHRRLSRLGKA
ncbi:MAG TPA: CoA-binding protein [Pseudonocardiaceae bacterium]|nr:CoA-binding protein [Pseudonocardiaceae bacterium]